MTEPNMVMKKKKGPMVDSKRFVELWVSALKEKNTRAELYALIIAVFPHLNDEGPEKGMRKMTAKMYAINATISKRTGGKKLRYPDDPDAKKGPKGEFKQFILGQADEWGDAGLFGDE
jgi:hypothetical protein